MVVAPNVTMISPVSLVQFVRNAVLTSPCWDRLAQDPRDSIEANSTVSVACLVEYVIDSKGAA